MTEKFCLEGARLKEFIWKERNWRILSGMSATGGILKDKVSLTVVLLYHLRSYRRVSMCFGEVLQYELFIEEISKPQ